MMADMDFLLIILVVTTIVYLLHRDDRSNGTVERYWSAGAGVDRDILRVRADLLAGADALSRQPLRRPEPSSSDWEPRA